MNYYTDVLKKYAEFNGRASRKEYWMFFLCNILIVIALGIINVILFKTRINLLGDLYNLAIFIPSLAVLIRRLHDTNRSGWWVLIGLIPVIGWIWIFVLLVLPGTVGENKYGSNLNNLNKN